jgi:hypothetical protein
LKNFSQFKIRFKIWATVISSQPGLAFINNDIFASQPLQALVDRNRVYFFVAAKQHTHEVALRAGAPEARRPRAEARLKGAKHERATPRER